MPKIDEKVLLEEFKNSTAVILAAVAAVAGAKQIGETILEVDKAASEVIKIFGQGQSMVLGLKQSMTQAVAEVDKLGGTFNDILTIQSNIATNFGRNLVLSSDSYEGFYATMKVTGVETGKMVDNFKDVGVSAYDSVSQMQKVVDIARESGVNAGKVASLVTDNLGNLNKYNFQGGVEGLAKMASQAASLRIDMSATLNFAKDVFKPEGAIEMAAALQRLGVAQSDLLDPLRLMDLSANDPTELQNQIVQMTQQFTKMNSAGKFEIMPGAKRQMMEIADAMHIPYEQLTKMALGSADLNEKMKQIKFPDTAVSEDQKKMIANLAEMKDGKAMVTFNNDNGEQVTKEVSQLTAPEIAILEQGKVQKSVEELAKEQLSTQEDMMASLRAIRDKALYGVAGSKAVQTGLGLQRKVFQGAEKIVPKELSVAAVQNKVDVTAAGLLSGNMTTASTTIQNLNTDLKNFAATGVGNAKIEFEKLVKAVHDSITSLQEITKTRGGQPFVNKNKFPVKDFIKLPNQTIQPLEQDTLFGGTGFEKLMGGMGKSSTESSSMKHEGDININLSVKIDAPQGVDISQLQLAMNSPEITQKMTMAVQQALSGNGQFGNPNQTKRNNDVRNKLITS